MTSIPAHAIHSDNLSGHNQNPLTYRDYIQTEQLLSLQKPRTDYKDEEIFIMYHQITELILKMIEHEIRQPCFHFQPETVWIDKLTRVNRYVSIHNQTNHIPL